ncbi:energy transducer TonB [Mucilaginibacter ginsenosidivorans]|uniref:Energy transducer TonB n=1 Tax=Mucilaginibacter ginsenosidivorans TaxID=398053 RepID=A0A5B8UZJ5_9SPHI|nr:energy transducer TonB [Mucilaginibacter ginsenosidivorans]QEC64452.1 energy transducer TonB [Mucilaginibacter ginsenosidivorans]
MKTAGFLLLLVLTGYVAKAQGKIKVSKAAHVNKTFTGCDDEVLASFPGGMRNFNRYIKKSLHYPPHAVVHHIQGKVLLNFAVEKDGSVSAVKVIKGVSPDLDAEAVRILKHSPKWHPTTECGKPAVTEFNLPINFSLKKPK